jgi:hypothetical protein
MNMLFGVAFLSQILLVSFYYPRELAKVVLRTSADPSGDDVESQEQIGSRVWLYTAANRLMIAFGLVLLTLFSATDIFGSLTAKLLAVGLFFFSQLAPLEIVRSVFGGPSTHASRAPNAEDPPGATKFLDFTSPVLLGVAGVLFLAYVATHLPSWGGGWNPQLVKMLIFVGSNVFFAATLGWQWFALGRERGDARVRRIEDLKRIAPTLLYISIGLSIYFFGKDLIFQFGVAQVRPIMMTVFLQMLGVLAFSTMTERRQAM